MAIHIDIIAHLNQRRLMLEGEQLRNYANSLERDINRTLERGAVGRNSKIVASNNKVLDSDQRMINSGDKVTEARNRETAAIDALTASADRYIEIEGRLNRARSDASRERHTQALREEAETYLELEARVESLGKARAKAEQDAATSARNQALAQRLRREEVRKGQRADAEARVELQRFTSVQDRATVALAGYTAGLDRNTITLNQQLVSNRGAIDSNRRLRGSFDGASESVNRYNEQQQKLIDMMNSGKANSRSLQAQVNSTGRAYRNMERSVRNATESLQEHVVEEAKAASRSPFGRGGRDFPDPGSFFARNLGALTPLGTVTPGILIPLGAAFFAMAQGVVAASQSLLLLPAALTAGVAGFGVMQMATMGVSDAFTSMMDFNNPEKFAESLRLLSPAAQQFVLSIQQLIPTFMELKNVVQDTFFAGMPQLVNGLAQTYRDSFGNMAVGVADAFNGIFMEIGSVLQDPKMQQTMGVMFDGIVKTFQALIPLVGSFTQVFVQLSSTGAQVLPTVIGDLANMMSKFSDFIDKAAASGDLTRWMTDGWEALKAVGEVVVYAGKMIYDVFGLHGPEDIARFKTTLFGLIDGFGVFFGALRKFFEGLVRVVREIVDSPVGQFLGDMIDKVGGLESALAVLAGGFLVVKIGLSFYKMFKFFRDGAKFALMKLSLLTTGLGALPAVAGTAGAAGGAAAGAGLTAAGGAAGGGFAARAAAAMKNFGWVGIGTAIAAAISAGLRDGLKYGNGDPVSLLPSTADFDLERRTTSEILYGPILGPLWDRVIGATPQQALPPGAGGGGSWGGPDNLPPMNDGSVIGRDGKPYEPVERGTPGAVVIPGTNQYGKPQSGSAPSRRVEGYTGSYDFSAIPGIPPGGFPLPTPNPGGGPKPDIPYDQYSLQSIPLGQFAPAQQALPDPRSLMSQLTPNQLSQQGYGYQVDPQGVFDAESRVLQQRAAVEEARARVLELAQDNQATEQDKLKAQSNIIETERSYLKTQVELLEAQRGTWKKINESIGDQANLLEGLGAEIDADFGISRGLPGIAENITKFLANIVAAPVYGALAGMRGAGGDLGGAKGLLGAAALSGAFGPQFMQPQGSADSLMAPGAQVMAPGAQIIVPGGTFPGAGAGPGSGGTDGSDWSGGAGDFGPNLFPSPGQGMPMPYGNRYPLPGAGYPGDAAILSQIPKGGRYDSVTKDLTKGLVDCASGVEDLVNLIDGKPTAGGSLTTFNAASVLPQMGFQRGMGGPGDFRVGYTNTGTPHMEATLPDGTPVNFGSSASVASGGVSGAGGANSPGFTDFFYRPMTGPGGSSGGSPGLYPSPGQGMPMPYGSRYPLPPLTPSGGDGGTLGPVTPGGYAPITPGQLTGTGLVNPTPLAPGGYTPPGTGPSQIGAVVGPPEGTGSGFGGFSGGLLGAAQGAIGSAAGAAGMMAGGAGGPAAGALAQIGIEQLNRAIAFAGQAAGIGVSGLMETFMPTGGSELANNSWFTKILGGVVGMKPLLPNFANVSGAANGVQQGQHLGNNPQGTPGPGNVNVTQNNYAQNGNSTTSDLERATSNAAAASMPAMGAGR